MLEQRLEAEVVVRGDPQTQSGREFHELTLTSEDGQTLRVYEGQLKELRGLHLEPGQRYRLVLRPFINNRWVELKIERMELIPSSSTTP